MKTFLYRLYIPLIIMVTFIVCFMIATACFDVICQTNGYYKEGIEASQSWQ